MKKTVVIAPHFDDELLGCGGTMLRKAKEGNITSVILVTNLFKKNKKKNIKDKIIKDIKKKIKFKNIYELNFEASELTSSNIPSLIKKISAIFKEFKPDEVYVPHSSDIHTDHKIISEATLSCTKWFRYPFIKNIFAYETLSETNFNISDPNSFKPNYYVNITSFFDKKLEALKIYKQEINSHPFPRSKTSITALANLRGSESGFKKAEAFQLLKGII
jgi:LmbE family N-acetylglucosaminyl deacetylase